MSRKGYMSVTIYTHGLLWWMFIGWWWRPIFWIHQFFWARLLGFKGVEINKIKK